MPKTMQNRPPLKSARGWCPTPEPSAKRSWVLPLGALIRARVVQLAEIHYSASVASLVGHSEAEFGLLEAQRWCEEEIGWLLLETKASLKFNRTRGVCSGLFERSFCDRNRPQTQAALARGAANPV